jgi:hypothetical protein
MRMNNFHGRCAFTPALDESKVDVLQVPPHHSEMERERVGGIDVPANATPFTNSTLPVLMICIAGSVKSNALVELLLIPQTTIAFLPHTCLVASMELIRWVRITYHPLRQTALIH